MPFIFRRSPDGTIILVNQAGDYVFLRDEEFESLVATRLDTRCETFFTLKSKHFVAEEDINTAIDLLATKMRTRKGHLRFFTTLHMVVVTANCNSDCRYCQASSTSPDNGIRNMSFGTARAVVDMIFESPSPDIKIEFQGGEPLLNWDVVRYIVEYAEKLNARRLKRLEFVLCTNLTLINESIFSFLEKNNIKISTSLDGPRHIHDENRILRNGESSYEAFKKKLTFVRESTADYPVSPLLTVTRQNLGHLRSVIDEYVALGFSGIFLRSINPYGLATSEWEVVGYEMEAFIDAYKEALAYIIELNKNGVDFTEYYTSLLLTRILTPFATGFVDLQSPAGAGISGVIYDYNGDVYPTDEARMLSRTGDKTFKLGNVETDKYMDIFGGAKLRNIIFRTCVEVLPQCALCAYQLYCGVDPIRNYVECGDITGHRPTSGFCKKNMALLDHIFSLLRTGDAETVDIFWAWVTGRPVSEVRI